MDSCEVYTFCALCKHFAHIKAAIPLDFWYHENSTLIVTMDVGGSHLRLRSTGFRGGCFDFLIEMGRDDLTMVARW